MKCPKCGTKLNIGKLLRQKPSSDAQRAASAANGAKGGRPPGKRKSRHPSPKASAPTGRQASAAK